MAKSISDEELQLRKRARRRLIGAIAVVTIVAVFLPMVLDHEPKPVSQDVSIRIPSPNSGIFTSKIVPLVPGAPDAKPAPAATPKPDSPRGEPAKSVEAPARIEGGKIVDAPRSEPAKTAAVPMPKATETLAPPAYDTEAAPPKKTAPPKPADKPAAVPAVKPPAKTTPVGPTVSRMPRRGTGFVVQVAALNDAEKAKQMLGQIAAAGIKSYTEVVPTTKGNVTRVRAGPFASREEAEKMRDRLKGMGLSGNIVPK